MPNNQVRYQIKPSSVNGIPTYINHESDFGAHLGFNTESQFIAANLKADDGREFGIMLHMGFINPKKLPLIKKAPRCTRHRLQLCRTRW